MEVMGHKTIMSLIVWQSYAMSNDKSYNSFVKPCPDLS